MMICVASLNCGEPQLKASSKSTCTRRNRLVPSTQRLAANFESGSVRYGFAHIISCSTNFVWCTGSIDDYAGRITITGCTVEGRRCCGTSSTNWCCSQGKSLPLCMRGVATPSYVQFWYRSNCCLHVPHQIQGIGGINMQENSFEASMIVMLDWEDPSVYVLLVYIACLPNMPF